jgi:hypothetical protein
MNQTSILTYIFGALILFGLVFLYLQGVFNKEKPETNEHFENNRKMTFVEHTPEQLYMNEKNNTGLIDSIIELNSISPGKSQTKITSESKPTKSTIPTSVASLMQTSNIGCGWNPSDESINDCGQCPDPSMVCASAGEGGPGLYNMCIFQDMIGNESPGLKPWIKCGSTKHVPSPNPSETATNESPNPIDAGLDNMYRSKQARFDPLVASAGPSESSAPYQGDYASPSAGPSESSAPYQGDYASPSAGPSESSAPYQGGSASDSTGPIDSPAPYDTRDSDMASAEFGDSSAPAERPRDLVALATALSDSPAGTDNTPSSILIDTETSNSGSSPLMPIANFFLLSEPEKQQYVASLSPSDSTTIRTQFIEYIDMLRQMPSDEIEKFMAPLPQNQRIMLEMILSAGS